MFPITAYAWCFVIFLIGSPFILLGYGHTIPFVLVLSSINITLLTLVWHFCSSPQVSFIGGIHIISSKLTSGCANITILYLFPFLAIVYLIFTFLTIMGLFRGRKYTQDKWIHFILHFVENRAEPLSTQPVPPQNQQDTENKAPQQKIEQATQELGAKTKGGQIKQPTYLRYYCKDCGYVDVDIVLGKAYCNICGRKVKMQK